LSEETPEQAAVSGALTGVEAPSAASTSQKDAGSSVASELSWLRQGEI